MYGRVRVSVEKWTWCRIWNGLLKSSTLTDGYYYFIFFLKGIASLNIVDFSIELEPNYKRSFCFEFHFLLLFPLFLWIPLLLWISLWLWILLLHWIPLKLLIQRFLESFGPATSSLVVVMRPIFLKKGLPRASLTTWGSNLSCLELFSN